MWQRLRPEREDEDDAREARDGAGRAADDARAGPAEPVPLHLRNAPTRLMKSLDYGKGYRYAHDEAEGYAAGEDYFPEGMPEVSFYRPADRGLEAKIAEKLAHLRELDHNKPFYQLCQHMEPDYFQLEFDLRLYLMNQDHPVGEGTA